MNLSPETDSVLRLHASVDALIAALPSLDGLFFQARNCGGGLGKRLQCFAPIVIGDMDFAFDADNGIGFSVRSLVAVHAGRIEVGRESAPALDFEFDDFPAGMSLHELPGMSESGTIARFADLFGGRSLDARSLHDWRKLLEPDVGMCPCCAERSEQRARNALQHPLHGILEDAMRRGSRLECRLLSDHVDATSSFIPFRISERDGVLVATDVVCENALHLDMRMVHALAIDGEKLDGTDYSILRIFDMHGRLNFQLMCEELVSLSVWQSLCNARKI